MDRPLDRRHCSALACLILAMAAITGCERPYERERASAPENLARNVSTVPHGAEEQPDRAAVAPPVRTTLAGGAQAISDAVIAAKIGAQLMADPAMRGADVSVNAEHGVVMLVGNVKSYEQVGIASGYAQREDGVMRVDNQLALAPQ